MRTVKCEVRCSCLPAGLLYPSPGPFLASKAGEHVQLNYLSSPPLTRKRGQGGDTETQMRTVKCEVRCGCLDQPVGKRYKDLLQLLSDESGYFIHSFRRFPEHGSQQRVTMDHSFPRAKSDIHSGFFCFGSKLFSILI